MPEIDESALLQLQQIRSSFNTKEAQMKLCSHLKPWTIAILSFCAATSWTPPLSAQAAAKQPTETLTQEGPNWKNMMIQPGRRVVQYLTFDANVEPSRLKELLRRLDSISAQYKSGGKARYWSSVFCSNGVGRLNATIEFPDAVAMAQAWEKIHSGPEIYKWEADARAEGLVLKSQMFLDNIQGSSLLDDSYESPLSPPQVMQFLEIDPGAHTDKLLESNAFMTSLTDRLHFKRTQRVYRMNWTGERPLVLMAMVGYPSMVEMMRENLVIDNSPEFLKFAMTLMQLQLKPYSQCISTEIRL